MNNTEEIMETIYISLLVAAFLFNTGRALKAIELCKERLVLLNDEALSIEEQFINDLVYEGICRTMLSAYNRISDNTNAVTYGCLPRV